MSKVNVSKIVSEIQALYKKDEKAKKIISSGDTVKTVYTLDDVVPIAAGHPLQTLLSLPGIPYNKIVQVAGAEDCGKSTWACELVVSAQKSDHVVIYWDAELKLDTARLTSMGGNPKEMLLVKTNEILKGAEIVRKFILAIKEQDPKAKILVIWDSVGASQSRSHAERELDSEKHAQPGQDAKENGSVLKMFGAVFNKYPDSIALYLVNQQYDKIGFMQKGQSNKGGKALSYMSSFIVVLKQIKELTKQSKGSTLKVGIISRAKVKKNHLNQNSTSISFLDFQVTAAGSVLAEDQGVEDEQEE